MGIGSALGKIGSKTAAKLGIVVGAGGVLGGSALLGGGGVGSSLLPDISGMVETLAIVAIAIVVVVVVVKLIFRRR